MNKSVFRHIAAACAALALIITPTASAAEFTLKLHHFLGPKAPSHAKMLAPWAERIEKASGGRLKIDIYPSMTLGGKPPQLFRQVKDGVVDIIWTVNGYTPGVFPRTEVFELPFIHTNDAAATNLAMRELFESHLADDFKDVKVLFLHVHGGNGFHTVDKPVREVGDLAGLKIRTPSRTGGWILEALGATSVGMPVPELPTALSRKVVDGALIPFEIIPPFKLQEVTKYQIEGVGNARFGNTTFQVSMNKDTWNKLPPDLQKIIGEQSGDMWAREIGDMWSSWESGGLNVALKAGNEHIEIPAAEMERFREKLNPVAERWIAEVADKGVDGRALIDAARKAVAKHSKR